MALKRINKELTDLGRYVGPHALYAGGDDTYIVYEEQDLCPSLKKEADVDSNIETLPHHALQVPSAMIWSVTLPLVTSFPSRQYRDF